MNFPLRRSSIVAFVGLCAFADAFAGKSALRCDGLYRCSEPTDDRAMASYLRFYPDGIVVATTRSGTLHDVTKRLNRQQCPNFHYTIRGNSIEFTDHRGGASSYVYSGKISSGSLTLFIDRYYHRESAGYVQRTYDFAHIDFPR